MSEVLVSVFCFVDGDRERNLLYIRRNVSQIHLDLLIIAITFTCAVVAGVNYGSVLVLLVVEENEVALFSNLVAGVHQEYGNVQVEILAAVIFIGIPSETDSNFGQARIGFGQINFLPFG
ncbi:hypothetical protein D3C73_1163160 [compost metagenome]